MAVSGCPPLLARVLAPGAGKELPAAWCHRARGVPVEAPVPVLVVPVVRVSAEPAVRSRGEPADSAVVPVAREPVRWDPVVEPGWALPAVLGAELVARPPVPGRLPPRAAAE